MASPCNSHRIGRLRSRRMRYRKGLNRLRAPKRLVTVRGELYKKSAGKKKADASAPLKLLILEVQKKE